MTKIYTCVFNCVKIWLDMLDITGLFDPWSLIPYLAIWVSIGICICIFRITSHWKLVPLCMDGIVLDTDGNWEQVSVENRLQIFRSNGLCLGRACRRQEMIVSWGNPTIFFKLPVCHLLINNTVSSGSWNCSEMFRVDSNRSTWILSSLQLDIFAVETTVICPPWMFTLLVSYQMHYRNVINTPTGSLWTVNFTHWTFDGLANNRLMSVGHLCSHIQLHQPMPG